MQADEREKPREATRLLRAGADLNRWVFKCQGRDAEKNKLKKTITTEESDPPIAAQINCSPRK